MEIVAILISIIVIALGMFMLLKNVWQAEANLKSYKIYVALICSFLVAGSIYFLFLTAMTGLTAYSSLTGFNSLIYIVSSSAPFIVFLPMARFCKNKEIEPFTVFNIIFQTIIVLLIASIALIIKSAPVSFLAGIVAIFAIISFVIKNENKYYESVTRINNDLMNAQLNHYETIKQSNYEIRRIKHDMKNHLLVIKDMASREKPDEVTSYVDELLGEIANSEIFYRTGNEIVDAIISDKKAKAEKRGIKLEVTGNIMGCEISSVDLCTILANLLDNAIEAVSKLYGMNTKPVHNIITLDFKKNSNFVLITETNYAIAKMKEENNRILSSKGGSDHGFGISNIKNAVYRNGGEFNIIVKDEDFYKFEFEIMLPLN